MNATEREARNLLGDELAKWEAKSYRELVAEIGAPTHSVVVSPSGVRFGLEIGVHWDGFRGGPVRVLGAVDHGGLSAISPWNADFIKEDDGSGVD